MAAFGRLPPVVRRLLVRVGAPSYTVGAVVVLRRPDGRLLLVDQRHSGGWALPGGLLRRGEAPVHALVREVCEEVGVELDPRALPHPVAVVAPREQRVDLVFVVDSSDDAGAHRGDPAEVKRIGWFPPTELPTMTESTRDVLRSVLSA